MTKLISTPEAIVWRKIELNDKVKETLAAINLALLKVDDLQRSGVEMLVKLMETLNTEDCALIKFGLKESGWNETHSFAYNSKEKCYNYFYRLTPTKYPY